MARDIIVIGASAGGIEALSGIARSLPPDLPAALFVVVHIPANATSVLPRMLSRRGQLGAAHAVDGEEVVHGRIYIAPPDRHLLVDTGHVHLTRGPRENGHRPAVDPLFRSAALAYGPRVIGVVLSGNLDDGAAGLQLIRAAGGEALVQNPAEALYTGMPCSALDRVSDARVARFDEIAPLLVRLTGPDSGSEPERTLATHRPGDHVEARERGPELQEASAGTPASAEDRSGLGEPHEYESEATDTAAPHQDMLTDDEAHFEEKRRPIPGDLGAVREGSSGISCPECGGCLWEEPDQEVGRFRCRVGHAYSLESLMSEMGDSVEAALWSALNSLEEKADIARRIIRRLGAGSPQSQRFHEQAEEAARQALVLRSLLLGIAAGAESEPDIDRQRA